MPDPHSGNPAPLRVVAYARTSIDDHFGTSITEQFGLIDSYLAECGGRLTVQRFQDYGMCGDASRPGLQAVRTKLEAHLLDVLVCTDVGRLHRDVRQSAELIKRAVERGVKVVCLDNGIGTAPRLARG